jgi:hypothetical protein
MTVASSPRRIAESLGPTGGELAGTLHGYEAVKWDGTRMDVDR